jgi:hypothetical protein
VKQSFMEVGQGANWGCGAKVKKYAGTQFFDLQ